MKFNIYRNTARMIAAMKFQGKKDRDTYFATTGYMQAIVDITDYLNEEKPLTFTDLQEEIENLQSQIEKYKQFLAETKDNYEL